MPKSRRIPKPKDGLVWPSAENWTKDAKTFAEWKRRFSPVGIKIEWSERGGRWVPVEVSIRMLDKSEITASKLHSIAFAAVFRRMRGFRLAHIDGGVPDELRRMWEEPRVGRPPSYPPEHWAKVARVYLEAQAEGRPTRRAIQQTFAECQSEATARNWVARCRQLGLLESWKGTQ